MLARPLPSVYEKKGKPKLSNETTRGWKKSTGPARLLLGIFKRWFCFRDGWSPALLVRADHRSHRCWLVYEDKSPSLDILVRVLF